MDVAAHGWMVLVGLEREDNGLPRVIQIQVAAHVCAPGIPRSIVPLMYSLGWPKGSPGIKSLGFLTTAANARIDRPLFYT